MKPDEVQLLLELARVQVTQEYFRGRPGGEFATTIGQRLGINPKRTLYILYKWTDKDWWNYGVSARTGWLTDKGLEAARSKQ